ncbi:hypothetical protein [Sinomonas sp. B1-1]|uniref:hypothetical protein n=1 Tax=Sinomonas sp. B1-1 TaxID=3141454 RepID=UPI003D2C0EF1
MPTIIEILSSLPDWGGVTGLASVGFFVLRKPLQESLRDPLAAVSLLACLCCLWAAWMIFKGDPDTFRELALDRLKKHLTGRPPA